MEVFIFWPPSSILSTLSFGALSSSIHIVSNGKCLWLKGIHTHVCVWGGIIFSHTLFFFFIHQWYGFLYPDHWTLRLFPCFGYYKSLEMNMRVWISFQVSRLAESLGRSIFNFSGTLYAVFHGDFTHLHCHQDNAKVSFSPCPHQHTAILIGVKWQLFVSLICIYLIISDVDHIFKCLLVICLLLQPNECKRF